MLLHHQEKLHLPRSISASSRRPLAHGFNISYGSEDKSPRTKDISKERLTQPHTACKAIGNTFPNSHRLSSEGAGEKVSITLNFQTFSTLKVKRPETLTRLSCRAKHTNHSAVLYNPSPLALALLPILGYQPARKYSEGKKNKKGSQQHDSAEGTSWQSRKLRRVIFGAVSRFLETHSKFLFHLLNNLRLGICTKHFTF